MKYSEVIAFRHKIESAAETQTDEQALESIDLYPSWQRDMDVVAGKRYRYNSSLYRCIQSHHTQSEWTPDITPALFTKVSIEEWPEWVRPISAETAYNKGDKVTFEGGHYISLIDANTWSPSEYPAGWTVIEV